MFHASVPLRGFFFCLEYPWLSFLGYSLLPLSIQASFFLKASPDSPLPPPQAGSAGSLRSFHLCHHRTESALSVRQVSISISSLNCAHTKKTPFPHSSIIEFNFHSCSQIIISVTSGNTSYFRASSANSTPTPAPHSQSLSLGSEALVQG